MGNIAQENIWELDINQIEVTDLVKGGSDGVANKASGQLANRTLWLKNNRGVKDGIKKVTSNLTALATDLNNLFLVTFKCTLTLPVTDIAIGTVIDIVASQNSPVGYGTIIIEGNNFFFKGAKGISKLYLYDGESVSLAFNSDGITKSWIVVGYNGNLFNAGDELSGRVQGTGTMIKNGALLNRSDYPRLWEYVQANQSNIAINDSQWLSSANGIDYFYQGFFSLGNGSTTFRLPDERGLFVRNLDLSRGIDLGRSIERPGGYEDDLIKAHTHGYNDIKNGGSYGDNASGLGKLPTQTDSFGGNETRPKNIGVLPLIKY